MIDVRYYGSYPGCELSNLWPHAFTFDDVPCASMEGLLQSFKFRDTVKQREVCALVGYDAKLAGRAGNKWRETQKLHWKDREYDRDGGEYQELLDHAYQALCQNGNFRGALLASGAHTLTHIVGHNTEPRTILTAEEFVNRLMSLRRRLQAGQGVPFNQQSKAYA